MKKIVGNKLIRVSDIVHKYIISKSLCGEPIGMVLYRLLGLQRKESNAKANDVNRRK